MKTNNDSESQHTSELSSTHEGLQSSGGMTMSPPPFSISAGETPESNSPTQLKAAPGNDSPNNAAPVQRQSSALGMRNSMRGGNSDTMQLTTIPTHYGEFKDKSYTAHGDTGVEIELEFHPNDKVDAEKISQVQTVKGYMNNTPTDFSPTRVDRTTDDGAYIDRVDTRNNPSYGGQSLDPSKEDLSDTNNTGGNYKLGWRYTDGSGSLKKKESYLYDRPSQGGNGNGPNSGQVFETAALALDGKQEGMYYGSVQWGWETDSKGKYKKLPLTMVSEGVPTSQFIDAAEAWNDSSSLGTIETTADPTNVYDSSYSVSFTIPKGTKVKDTEKATYMHSNLSYNRITVVGGTDAGKTGRIKTSDLKDNGDGTANVELPIDEIYTVSVEGTKLIKSDGTELALPAGTRLILKGWNRAMGNNVRVEVGQGDHTGESGTIYQGNLRHEQTGFSPLGPGVPDNGGSGGSGGSTIV